MLATSRSTYVVLLLLLYGAIGCLADADHTCMYDKLAREGKLPTVVVMRDVPKKGGGAQQAYTAASTDWAPVRIVTSTLDLENSDHYCTAIGDMRSDFRGGNVECSQEQILTEEVKAVMLNQIIPQAVKLHQDRLSVQPLSAPIEVPVYGNGGMCSYFTIPQEHHSPGVSNADIVLYVAAAPSEASWSAVCSTLGQNGRPNVGIVSIVPTYFINSPRMVRVAAHEMAHTLGFETSIFRTLGMLTTVASLRGKADVSVVSSARTREEARNYYNCPTLEGMELDRYDTHWLRRNALDDLMTSNVVTGYYSAITLAAFVDTGFYQANFSLAEQMDWGKGAGCDLLTEKCLTNGITKYPSMFCNKTFSPPRCAPGLRALGTCSVTTHTSDLKPEYQYFADPKVGGDSEDNTDFCPIISSSVSAFCDSYIDDVVYPGSRSSPISRCLKGEGLSVGSRDVGDICADVKCEGTTVKVRYAYSDVWYDCPEGGYLQPTGGYFGSRGRIYCPRFVDACTIAPDGSSRVPLPDVPVPPTPSSSADNSNGSGSQSSHTSRSDNSFYPSLRGVLTKPLITAIVSAVMFFIQ